MKPFVCWLLFLASLAALTFHLFDFSAVVRWQIITLFVVMAAPSGLLGVRAADGFWQPPNFWTWVYNGCYVASYLLANSYWLIYNGHITPEGAEISKWGASYVLAVKFYTFHLFILLPLTQGILLLRVCRPDLPDHDLQAKIALAIWLAAESVSAVEYGGCKIPEPYAVAVAKTLGQVAPEYACQRAISFAAPYVVPLLTAAILLTANLIRRNGQQLRDN